MARTTTHDEVLVAIRDRLRNVLDLSPAQCFLSLSRWAPGKFGPGGEYWIVIAPWGSSFDESEQAGGGRLMVVERAEVEVAICTRIHVDQAERMEQAFLDANRGLFARKKAVIDALAGHDLLDASGNPLLVGNIQLVQARPVEYELETGQAVLSLIFSTPFCWAQ